MVNESIKIIFDHIIGKSTFHYGFTIPQNMYQYFSIPEKGYRKKINLIYYPNLKTEAWLNRVKNKYGHLQVRYDGKYGEGFKNWLKKVFKYSYDKTSNLNEFIQIKIVNHNLLEIEPFPITRKRKLHFSKILTHNIKEEVLISDGRFIELVKSIRGVTFKELERQMYYNLSIKNELIQRGWSFEQKVVNDKNIRLKCDYRKDDFQIEVEFGNARTYYQDIIKFVMSYNAGLINLGGLLVPSKSFSKHLCHLGYLNAMKRYNGKEAKYSGMMNFNKAINEFRYIKDIFNIPFFIIGINYYL